ncbi:MAG: cellulose biosynthesis cyclic di-GMP-binding regulatory protein BcsB, partial [Pseudomonadota bacterium]
MFGLSRLSALLMSLLIPAVLAAPAPPVKPVTPMVPAVPAEPVASTAKGLPLATYMTEDRPLRLTRTDGADHISIPLARRYRLEGAVLHLRVTNSMALLKGRSQLSVALNDRTVVQLPLNPEQPETTADIRLPTALFRPGYNDLLFSVSQHYTSSCEWPGAPELWTEIDTRDSTLTLTGELAPLEPRLVDLDDLFDPKLRRDTPLRILTVGETLTPEQLDWGGRVAQSMALRLRYVPLDLRHVPARPAAGEEHRGTAHFPGLLQSPLSDGDSVLMGTREQLVPYLDPTLIAAMTGPFLGVYPLDLNPRRLVLVVAGTRPDEVATAALTLGLLNFPYPDAPTMRVDEIHWPAGGDPAPLNSLPAASVQAFSRFGLRDRTLRGDNAEPLILEVNLPPDLYAPENATLDLRLHFAYGAGMRRDSVLNIQANGEFQGAIALDDPHGGVLRNYRVAIPLRSLNPGHNRLTFHAHLVPQVTGECTQVQTRNLILNLFADSTLTMPAAVHYATLPDLSLLARTGFPYTAGGGNPVVVVAGRDSDTAVAAWVLLAKLAQDRGLLLRQAEVVFALEERHRGRDILALGTPASLPTDLLKGAPLRWGTQGALPYPYGAGVSAEAVALEGNWLTRGWRWLQEGLPVAIEGRMQPATVTLAQSSEPGRYSLALQYPSPLMAGRTLTAILAQTPATLREGVTALVRPELWTQLAGDVATWRAGESTLNHQQVGRDYQVGDVGPLATAEFYFSRYPWIWFAALLLVTGVLAMLTAR